MNSIKISAREIFDSRKQKTIEVEASFGDLVATASVPSGKSTGSREAVELRDADGGVTSALAYLNGEIREMLETCKLDPVAIDQKLYELDGTSNYARLGANSVLAVSIVVRRLAAMRDRVPLWKYIAQESGSTPKFPALFMNVINGGAHGGFNLPFQEHLLIIHDTPHSAFEKGQKIFTAIGEMIGAKYGKVPIGDEGGYAPTFQSGEEEAFELLLRAIDKDLKVLLGIDVAASEFFKDGLYEFGSNKLTTEELGLLYHSYIDRFGLRSIEDPFSEFDEEPFAPLLSTVPAGVLIVGDDVTVTNKARVQELSLTKSVNAMIVKPNQVGTISNVYSAIKEVKLHGWKLIASHRSGETTDDFLADFAVGIGADGMKAGAPSQIERRVKYERLIAIEEESLGEIGYTRID